ncbi:Uncharacterised protein [Raoultella terrigena]|uniref:Uncharacterized protein n=1 Tax=Raoultella terrigena TaxID=577 RepID=A0A4U9DA75_RAOTE|nr:Uncharacterised protein [Raoultella terrigena]
MINAAERESSASGNCSSSRAVERLRYPGDGGAGVVIATSG